MVAISNETLNDQSHCTICLESLAVRTNVTLRCRHIFHLDCLGSAFNAANAMRCPVCRSVEEGVWRIFPTRDQEDVPEPNVQLQPPSGVQWFPDQGRFNGSLSQGNGGPRRHPYSLRPRRREIAVDSLNGSGQASVSSRITRPRLGGSSRQRYEHLFRGHHDLLDQVLESFPSGNYEPLRQLLNNLHPRGTEAQDVAFSGEPISNNSSSGMQPVEQTAFQAEQSEMVSTQLPAVGEPLPALVADVQRQNGIDDSEDIMSDG